MTKAAYDLVKSVCASNLTYSKSKKVILNNLCEKVRAKVSDSYYISYTEKEFIEMFVNEFVEKPNAIPGKVFSKPVIQYSDMKHRFPEYVCDICNC